MNDLARFALTVSALAAVSASAQEDIKAPVPNSAYVQDSRGVIARDPYGLCWHTGYWTPADAVPGCDGEMIKTAEAPPAAPAPVRPVAEKVTLGADTAFDFDKATLKPEGTAKLDELASHLKDMNPEAVVVVGHTDSVGSPAYNQELSRRRAETVKAYLASKGVAARRIYTDGKGESQPIADNKTADGQAKNRRVEIEVVGVHQKSQTSGF